MYIALNKYRNNLLFKPLFVCSAQLMLNVLPLTTLLTAPFESLKKALPWIPESILKVRNSYYMHDDRMK